MNYFLILVILAVGGGSYFEYNTQKIASGVDQRQLADEAQKLVASDAEKQKLTSDNADLQKQIADLQTKTSGLQGQVATLKQAAEAPAPVAAVEVAKPVAPVPVSPDDLGTLTTLDGKTYENCRLLRVSATGIVISCQTGITEVLFNLMSPDAQKRYGYNPANGPTLTADQINANNLRLTQ